MVIAGVLVSGIVISMVIKNGDVERIKENPKHSYAKIVGHGIPKKSSDSHYGVWIDYAYEINGVNYTHSKKYYFPEDDELYFQGKYFPLVYSGNDPDLSRLLIINEDFEEFGLTQPDSLSLYNGKIY
jgi:hypothetical protein